MEGSCETGISHIHGESMWISSSEHSVIARINKIAKENPGEVTIIKTPEENDGCIYVKMPFTYLKLSGPRHMQLTEEERQVRAERLKQHRINKQSAIL